MPKVDLNPLIEGLHGKFGDAVFRVIRKDQQTVSKVPDMSKVQWSQRQKDQRLRIGEASHIVKALRDDPAWESFFKEIARQENKLRRRRKKRETRVCDMAVSYICHNGILPKSYLFRPEASMLRHPDITELSVRFQRADGLSCQPDKAFQTFPIELDVPYNFHPGVPVMPYLE